jgi:hypothetical protein
MTAHARTIPVETITANKPYESLCPQGWGYHPEAVAYCWRCPVCAGHVHASVEEHTTPAAIAADARCWSCRRQEEPHA